MQTGERVVLVGILLLLLGGAAWLYVAVTTERAVFRERVAAGEFELPDPAPLTATSSPTAEHEWRRYYPVTYPIRIGDARVEASVADTLSARIAGLSNTPYLPPNVVKLFAFGQPGEHSIWMKDMLYSLDIMWTDQGGRIIHIEEQVTPESFPQTFKAPTADAWFVVEANAGFVAAQSITIGDVVMIPRSN